MNILHLNSHVNSNNLSFPHYQFHKLLLENGHNSTLVVTEGNVNELEIKILKKKKLHPYLSLGIITRKLLFEILPRNKHIHYYPEWNVNFINERNIIDKLDNQPDLIIAYWTKYSFNQKMIYRLSKRFNAPVLLVLYDMAHLTGGCHYSFGCDKYKHQCGKCPALNSNIDIDISRITWKYKKKYIDKTNAYLLAGSASLLAQANESSLYKGKKIYTMLGSVDEEIFKPRDKKSVRKEMGLDEKKKIIFFGAVHLDEPRKGVKYLIDALNILKERIEGDPLRDEIHLLIAGNKLENVKLPFNHSYVGYLKTQELLAQAYQSADVFVCPSVEDAGPMMINLSIVAGTPVVSFDMGVATDLVHNDYTGYKARLNDSQDLANGLYKKLTMNEKEWNIMSSNCRQLGMELCSKSKQYERLIEIINDIIYKN